MYLLVSDLAAVLIRLQDAWFALSAQAAHVLGGAISDVATVHAYSERRRKGRSRNPSE